MAAWNAEDEEQRDETVASRSTAAKGDAVGAMSADGITSLFAELGNVAGAVAETELEQKLHVYRNLRLKLTYDDQSKTMRAILDLGEHRWELVRVRGQTREIFTR